MPAYLSRIAAAATAGGGNRRPFSPSIRSRSPIAERDQRLTLTGSQWDFEGTIDSAPSLLETLAPIKSAPGVEPAAPTSTPEISQGPSSPSPPLAHEFADSPESRHMGRETSTLRQPQTDNSPRRAGTPPTPEPNLRTEKQSASHEPPLAPATESTVQPARGVRRALDHPIRPKKSPINTTLPILEEANADAPSTVGQTALQTPRTERIERSFLEPRPVQQPPWRKESRAPGPPLTGGDPTARHRQSAAFETSPEVARPGVTIDYLHVEVVAAPAEKPKPKPAAPATVRPAPVSQIGPLRGVAKHLAFSVRQR
jgi:hypothetical protein